MTGMPWQAIVERLVEQQQAFRRQLAQRGVLVERPPAADPVDEVAHLQQAVLDQVDRCGRQLALRQEWEQMQQANHRRLWRFIEEAPVAIAMLDREMRYLAVSRRWMSDYGLLERGDLLGESHYAVFPEITDVWKAVHQRALAGEVIRATNDPFVRANGAVQWLRWEVHPWQHDDGTIGGIILFTEDITALKSVEDQLERQNRALRLLSVANEALIRVQSEESLLQHVCDIAIDAGGYRLAWVGYVDPGPSKVVRLVAHAGVDDGYLAGHTFSWDETQPEGQGPLGQTIRSRLPVFTEDFRTAPHLGSWRDDALAHGYQAGIVLPLIATDETIGAFLLYRAEPYHFSADEYQLLMELANDLAFGIVTLRTRAARRQAEAALHASEAFQREFARKTIEAATAGKLIICDREEIARIAGPPLATWEIRRISDLEGIRHAIEATARAAGMDDDRVGDFVLCISEMATNAYKHAGAGRCTLHTVAGALFAVIADEGPGIRAINLPELALKRGYTTGVSLGMGYKALISLADQVYLATGPGGTAVGIQMAPTAPPAPAEVFPGVADAW
jgi:PAS domain S-box-containing protein